MHLEDFQRLADKDNLLRLAVEAADIGFWVWDAPANRFLCTGIVNAVCGLAQDVELTLEQVHACVHPDDRQRVLESWAQAIDPAIRAPYDVEYRTVGSADGVKRWVSIKGHPAFDSHGACLRVSGTARDITHDKDEQAARRLTDFRLALLDSIAQSTRALTDATAVMAVTARLLGEALGATRCAYADVEPDNDRFTIRSDWAVDGVPSSAGVYSLDLFGPQATSNLRRGQHLVVNDVDQELGDDGGGRMFNAIGIKALICAGLVKEGRLVAMMAVHQSTPRYWTADELSIVAEVIDRCWAHIERVRDAAALRDQDRRKDEFLATLAHELRNPIAPLRYATELLKRGGDPGREKRALETIDRQAEHLARLIDDLLDVSRINRGLIDLRLEPASVELLLRQAVEAARPALERAKHRLTVQLPDPSVTINADPARIVQVVTNLLNNAAKYTPDGGGVQLLAWPEGTQVLIQVVDNGIGIPPQDQGKLFQLFTQLPHTAKFTQGGLGIGLSLVKRLVEMHGGDVHLQSAGIDEGSTFTLRLPLMQTALVPAVETPQPAGSATSGRVLVVEDNPDGLDALLSLLELVGIEARGAVNGRDALELASQWQPHVVLLDLGLPFIDGYEVASRLRADPRTAGAILVALTGWGAKADKERTAAAGFNAHLTKPVEPDELMDSLNSWLGESAA